LALRFYKYIIYRLYSWRLKHKEDITPEVTVICTLVIVHFVQLLLIYHLIITFLFRTKPLDLGRLEVYGIVAFLIGIYSLLFYRKAKWKGYLELFKDETKKERKKGTILLLLFFLGSFVLTFATVILTSIFVK
jgi:hypothetical protein